MRLPLLSSSALNHGQRQLYDDMRKGIETNFKGFTAIDDSGRLIGPWNRDPGHRSPLSFCL